MQIIIVLIGTLLSCGAASAHGSLPLRIGILTERLESDPRNVELLLKRGELYRQHRNWQAALDNFSQALQLDPDAAIVDFFIGRVLHQAGRPSEALPRLRRFVQSDPDHANGWLYMARSAAALGMLEDASEMYRKAIMTAPVKTPDHYLEWSEAHFANSPTRVGGAIAILENGIARLGPIVSMVQRAMQLKRMTGDLDGAMRYLEMLPSALKNSPRWLTTRADLRRESQTVGEAIGLYLQALAAIDKLPASRRHSPALTELKRYLQRQLSR